ncbi:MAG: flippase-like domain-containing protein [Anaerovibrio sp.]|uniref:lysylphosphatidylglycerol synthase transmembrane domain-containing protein n=1 Tax=uncultured Anaerovibrio sp. TaxID=361586 RepID=UPI0026000726|nr:lysylphosphatidylglycerol synthase transmembrane domain-containing protein [uncultured Anaerovibrio sp.]MBQ3853546.1 flippase-like domain-containing protein [Anaerovibrio sp.]
MNKVYGRIVGLFLLIVLISSAVIYFTVDINTITNLYMFKPWSVIMAILAMVIGLVLDGTRLMHMVRISDENITLEQAVQVVFGNYFLAMLGPGAAAGAIAQVMFLRKAGIPGGKAAVLALVRTLVSIMFLACCLPFIFLHDEGILPGVSNDLMVYVAGSVAVLMVLLAYGIKKNAFDYLAVKITKKLPRKWSRKFVEMYRDSKAAVKLLASSPLSMVRVFFESGLSLIFIYMIVPFLMLGLGVNVDWLTVMGRMMFLNILLYFSPTPGGSGIAEGGFVYLFSSSVPSGTVGILAVSWRFIAEYLPFFVGLYYTITVFGKSVLNKDLDEEESA